MQQVYIGRNHLDSVRFQNFLVRHGIDAQIRKSVPHDSEPVPEDNPTVSSVWVEDERSSAAGVLLDDFLSIINQSTDEEDPAGGSSDDEPADEPAPVRARIPWLTVLISVSCIIASVGMWRSPGRGSTEAYMRWGWRDGLDAVQGSYWAIFTSILLHATVEHLFMNLLGIALLGYAIERTYGRICWLGLLLSAALVSAAANLGALGQLGHGASGVVFAFYGFALMASVRNRFLPIWIMILLSIWLIYIAILDVARVFEHHLFGQPIDTGGSYVHLTGLTLGILFALAFAISWKPLLTRTALASAMFIALVPLRGSPWLLDWNLLRAERAYREESVSAAIDWYSQAIARDPKSAAAYVGRGEMLLLEARFDEALTDFDAAVLNDPKTRYARGLRAQGLLCKSKFDAALDAANQELNDGRVSSFAYAERGEIYLIRNEFDAAVRDLTSAIDVEPRTATRWSTRAIARLKQSQHEMALADADHAVWLDSHDGSALLVRGLIFVDLSRNERARTDLGNAYNLLIQDLQRRPRDVWIHCGLVETQLGLFELDPAAERLANALEHAEQLLKLAPDYWLAWAHRGAIQLEQKRFSQAERDLSRALELNPQDAWVACNRGLARHELGRSGEALIDLSEALAMNPKSAYAYRSRAIVRHANGQFREADDDLTRAIELNPRFAEAYQLRGKARFAVGEQEAGSDDLRRATGLDPRLAIAIDAGQTPQP